MIKNCYFMPCKCVQATKVGMASLGVGVAATHTLNSSSNAIVN